VAVAALWGAGCAPAADGVGVRRQRLTKNATLNPTADARILESAPDTNYGTELVVDAQGVAGTERRAVLKFDLTTLNVSSVATATLRLYQSVCPGAATIDVAAVADDTWTETGVTWNSQPAAGDLLGSVAVGTCATWYAVDVTAFVDAQVRAGDPVISLSLTTAGAVLAQFDSREGTNKPQLVLNYAQCGDAVVEGAETCDDGNTTSCNGCSSRCQIEPFVDWYVDADGDGYGDANQVSIGPGFCAPASGAVANNLDCNDADPEVHPGVPDWCGDGADPNCSGDDACPPPGTRQPPDKTLSAHNARHSCAVKADGTVWCWGRNANGQCGIGNTTTPQKLPVQVTGITNAVAVTTGQDFSCAVLADGTAKCWGYNGYGQLGNGNTTQQTTPVAVQDLGVGIAGVDGGLSAHGGQHTCSIKAADGSVWCWGYNGYGQLGDNTTTARELPVRVTLPAAAVSVDTGYQHTCAALANGTAWCWGRGDYGRLGNGATADAHVPVQVSGLTTAAAVTCGELHSCARLTDGTARCWGEGANGRLGNGTTTDSTTPVTVTGLAGVAQIEAGQNFNCARLTDGTLRCWGYGGYGRLGNGATADALTPVTVNATVGAKADRALSAHLGVHTCSIKAADGSIWCWGENGYGQLGDGTTTDRLAPVRAGSLTGAVALTTGYQHTCAVLASGAVWCWGNGAYGRLGNGATANQSSPVQVTGVTTAVAVSAGELHSCARLADGTARCWGRGANGRLGNGATADSSTPVTVTGLTGAAQLQTGSDFNCARLGDATVRCWGAGAYGRLGNGLTTDQTTPVTVTGLTDAQQLGLGWDHACAIVTDGHARCWGYGANGRRGDNTTTSTQSTPTWVALLTDAVAIAGGLDYTCAVLADGTGRCWGRNTYGQLGDGTSGVDRLTPVTVKKLTGATDITSGYVHACARHESGGVRCWGETASGRVGDGQGSTDRLTPALVGGLAAAVDLGIGYDHACAVFADGGAWCWGYGGNGRRGDGATSETQSTPRWVEGAWDAVHVAAGLNHSCGLFASGKVRCWGHNGSGELGDGTVTQRLTPVTINVPAAVEIWAGYDHTCARLANGTARCWGDGSQGQLGDGNKVDHYLPVSVAGLGAKVVEISAGQHHTCALLSDSSIHCFGLNDYGQLGDGSTSTRTTAVATAGLSGTAVAVSAGLRFTCALLADGRIDCWGRNHYGQLGNGTTTTGAVKVPVPVAGIAGAVSVGAGDGHACAALADGTARCWGAGANGRLGNGGVLDQLAPVAVSGLDGVAAIVAGWTHTCALQTLGGAWCWGDGTYGQLGDGSTSATQSTPVQVFGVSTGRGITVGQHHSCALLADGTGVCWGRNDQGQIGDNTVTQRNSRVWVVGLSSVSPGQAVCTNGILEPGEECDDGNTSNNDECLNTCTLATCGDGHMRGGVEECDDGNSVDTDACRNDCHRARCGDGVIQAGVEACDDGNTNDCDGCSATCTVETLRAWYPDFDGDGYGDAAAAPTMATCKPAAMVANNLDCNDQDESANPGAREVCDDGVDNDCDGLDTVCSTAEDATVNAHLGQHSCGIRKSDGTVWCWGLNTYGALGNGTTTQATTPVQVAGVSGAVAVSTGFEHTCAVLADGTGRCWGRNNYNQLGDGTTTNALTPTIVVGLWDAVGISAGPYHTCASRANGTARCWGRNNVGQLGDGTLTQRSMPVAVSGLTGVHDVGVGELSSCALLLDQTVRCWGEGANGRLGNGGTADSSVPVAVSGLSGAVNLGVGWAHACVVLADGTGKCWGMGGSGRLGNGLTTDQTAPVVVTGLAGAAGISAGYDYSCAALADGTGRCWGNNSGGRLGDGTTTTRTTPVAVLALKGARVDGGLSVHVAEHACSIKAEDGSVWCWGTGANGRLGSGATADILVANKVGGLSLAAIAVTTGYQHSCAVLGDGTAWCWGAGAYGRLGNGATTDKTTPVQVTGLTGATAITAGQYHTCALVAGGAAKCWGEGANGRLGNGSTTDQTTPVSVTGLTGAVEIEAGADFTCARLGDGTLRCWGAGANGHLGNGATTDQTTPVTVTGIAGATDLAVGWNHACALLADTTAKCWGAGGNGQRGDNTTTATMSTPVAVVGLTGATALTGGQSYGCALLAGGLARCWGLNTYGQLGDGTVTQKLVPVSVVKLLSATALTAGTKHTCAVLKDGTAQCWGETANGRVGDGQTATDRLYPVRAAGLERALAITAGYSHTCAVLKNGSAWCWGNGANGRRGDGLVTTSQTTAVEVLNLIGTATGCTPPVPCSFCGGEPDGCGGTCPLNNGSACDDGNPCTHSDTCVAGVCAGVAYGCSDGNQCTADVCNGDNTCAFPASTGACDDGDPCTANDVCAGGTCAGTQIVTCSGTADGCCPWGCTWQNDADCSCTPVCVGACGGEADGCGGTCPLKNGQACSDGNRCTRNDTCQGGLCSGTAITACSLTSDGCCPAGCTSANDIDCGNETPGTACGDGICSCNETAAGCPADCTNCGNGACAGTETAATCPRDCLAGGCAKTLGADCSTSLECASGYCAQGVCCATACIGKCGRCDLAASLGTCAALPTGTSCRPARGPCDLAEACNGASLSCPADGFAAAGTPCSGGVCNGIMAACPATGLSYPCDDGNPCTHTDRSNGVTCTGVTKTCPANSQCATYTLLCDGKPECKVTYAPAGTACTDGPVCASGKTCNGRGLCL
jgi:cysteine-rich repeat protein